MNSGSMVANKFKITLPSLPNGWGKVTSTCPSKQESELSPGASCVVRLQPSTEIIKMLESATVNLDVSWQNPEEGERNIQAMQVNIPSVIITEPVTTSKIIFVATNNGDGWKGNFGGVKAGDDLCNASTDKPKGSGDYKALLKGNNATKIGTEYITTKGVVLVIGGATTTNLNSNDDGTVRKAIQTKIGGSTGNLSKIPYVWTGLGSGTSTCNNWTSTDSSLSVTLGNHTISTKNWSNVGAPINCNQSAFLYCVEQ